MGLLDALIKSADRFEHEEIFAAVPVGYESRPVKWILNLDPSCDKLIVKGPYKGFIQPVPTRGDRSGKVSKNNIKPGLLVDNARYALGIASGVSTDQAFNAFRNLHEWALAELRNVHKGAGDSDNQEACEQLDAIVKFLCLDKNQRLSSIKSALDKIPEPADLISFQIGSRPDPLRLSAVREIWRKSLERECADRIGTCSTCGGDNQKLLRILPFKLRLFGERCPVVSINTDEQPSFGSFGKGQLANAPICLSCAGCADRVLRFLVQLDESSSSGRHAVVLAYDDSPNKTQPLRNQMAVFWTKQPVEVQTQDGPKPGELIPRLTLGDLGPLPEDQMPAYAAQVRDVLERPLTMGMGDTELPSNRFYLAVLSPNKSRLVVREWLEQDIETMRQNVRCYLDALQILHPAGRYVGFPPLPAMLAALQSPTSSTRKKEEKPRLPQVEPDLMRKLLRCMFSGSPPPKALLARAVRCFRVPDPPADNRHQHVRQQFRRMALAAAMKLILTHDNEQEQRAMEQRHTEHDDQSDYKRETPYLSGSLLAILEAIQSRPGNKVNTTLVDRFYGAASTAPATVFANLINMATKAHLPKLRREGKEWFTLRSGEKININDRIAETCAAIDNAGGFKPFLKIEEQGQFALGFYAERAELKPPLKLRGSGKSGNGRNDSNNTLHGDE